MAGISYKFNVDSVVPVPGLSPLTKHPENTVASHCLPWSCKSLRAAQERLQYEFWVIVHHHQNFLGCSRLAVCFCKRILKIMGQSQSPTWLYESSVGNTALSG